MISTGFPDLDRLIGGWSPGEFIVLAARPAMGKTSLLLSFLEVAARNNVHTALLYSLEEGAEKVSQRLISHLSGIPLTALGSPDSMRQVDLESMRNARNELGELMLLVNDSSHLTVSDIYHLIMSEKASLDAAQFRLALVAVDYLQVMQGVTDDKRPRYEELSEVIRDLKVLSRDLEVPLIVTAQLPLTVEKREDKRPVLTDLDYTGSIRQAADIVIFLYRDEYYNPDSEDAGMAEVIVAKNERGHTGTVRLKWRSETRQFLPLLI